MKKKLFSYIIFSLAGLILILGIIHLIMYISPQLEMINTARLEGTTTEENISNYFWKELVPQVISYIIIFVGFVSVLLASGMICIKLGQIKSCVPVVEKEREKNININKEDLDDEEFFEDFDEVESESKPEGE